VLVRAGHGRRIGCKSHTAPPRKRERS
jgi:hypothetical protein